MIHVLRFGLTEFDSKHKSVFTWWCHPTPFQRAVLRWPWMKHHEVLEQMIMQHRQSTNGTMNCLPHPPSSHTTQLLPLTGSSAHPSLNYPSWHSSLSSSPPSYALTSFNFPVLTSYTNPLTGTSCLTSGDWLYTRMSSFTLCSTSLNDSQAT
jgi:hypothetical protein